MTSTAPFEYSSRPVPGDELFLERLESFMQKNLADIRAFSERELRPFEETRRSIAEWHAKYLFQPPESTSARQEPSLSSERKQYVRSVMIDTSRLLENLASTSGIQSFFLAIDPRDSFDPGFLGGSIRGRAFWRNLRGGGEHGAKAFKQYCAKANMPPQPSGSALSKDPQASTSQSSITAASRQDAKTVKADLYEIVRKALRRATGLPNAEMKWTNHEKLDIYGVRLKGWPNDIPAQNPSTLKLSQNKKLLAGFKDGTINFERHPAMIRPLPDAAGPGEEKDEQQDADDLSWALDPDAVASGTDFSSSYTITSTNHVGPSGIPSISTAGSPPSFPPSETLTRETTPLDFTNLYDPPWSSFDPSTIYEPETNDLDWLDEPPRNRKRRRSDHDDDDDDDDDNDDNGEDA